MSESIPAAAYGETGEVWVIVDTTHPLFGKSFVKLYPTVDAGRGAGWMLLPRRDPGAGALFFANAAFGKWLQRVALPEGISIAPGTRFAVAPGTRSLGESVVEVRALWRGDEIQMTDGSVWKVDDVGSRLLPIPPESAAPPAPPAAYEPGRRLLDLAPEFSSLGQGRAASAIPSGPAPAAIANRSADTLAAGAGSAPTTKETPRSAAGVICGVCGGTGAERVMGMWLCPCGVMWPDMDMVAQESAKPKEQSMKLKTIKKSEEVVLDGVKADVEVVDDRITTVRLTDGAGHILVIKTTGMYEQLTVCVPAPPPTVKRWKIEGKVKGVPFLEYYELRPAAENRLKDLDLFESVDPVEVDVLEDNLPPF